MSRKGKLPIQLPKDVEVKISDSEVVVKGPKGTLRQQLKHGIKVHVEDAQMHITMDEGSEMGNYHGLFRSLINNMVIGTSQGFEKKLEMIGVGYRAAVQGRELDLQLGRSHPIRVPIPESIQVTIEKGTLLTIRGSDNQVVGQFAASVRAQRPPEPYQGKGIRYVGEYVRKKAGKAAATKK